MKLVKQGASDRQYQLDSQEGDCLVELLKRFPSVVDPPVKISVSDTEAKTLEREKLLNESLAEHRAALKRRAEELVSGGKLRRRRDSYLLTIDLEDREMLLQILNDLRVGSWRALGEPDSMEPKPNLSKPELILHEVMGLAGFFEYMLLDLSESGEPLT